MAGAAKLLSGFVTGLGMRVHTLPLRVMSSTETSRLLRQGR